MDGRRMVVDTSVFIKNFRATNKEETLLYKLSKDVKIITTSVTIYELMIGAKSTQHYELLNEMLEEVKILSFNEQAAQKAAEIYHELRLKNQMIEFRDIFIAAICIVNDLELLTFNEKHFNRIEGLKIYSR